jgi:DUF1365 family protein
MLLCFPRVLGYVFDPLSVYFCYDGNALAALVYEVKNTFGGQHVYAFRARRAGRGGRLAVHACAKDFHVSPFLGMAARYRFHLAEPAERLAVVIRATEGDAPLLVASQAGERRKLRDRTILGCLAGDLFMTLKVVVGIHVEALRLWRKGAPLFPRDARSASPRLG